MVDHLNLIRMRCQNDVAAFNKSSRDGRERCGKERESRRMKEG